MAIPQIFKDYIVHFKKSDRIYSAGDPGTEMYIVQGGSVEIFQEAGGKRVSLAIMEKGDFFGEMALIESAPHSSNAEALADCEVIEINSTLFDKMIKGNIEIAVRMLRKLSIRLRDATLRIEQMELAAQPAAAIGSAPRADEAPFAPPTAPAAEDHEAPEEPVSVGRTHFTAAAGSKPNGCHAMFVSDDGQTTFPLLASRAAIGRFDPVTGLKPEVDLSELDLNRSVSRHHARLTFEGGVYALTEEVGALNGTFINGKRLVSGKPARLKNGDVVNLGMVKLTFQEISG